MDSAPSSCKKLSQTKISFYFPGYVKRVPTEPLSGKRKGRAKVCRRISYRVEKSDVDSTMTNNRRKSLECVSPENLAIIQGIPKRKLPAPIFSEDEDSENDHSVKTSPRKSEGGTPTKQAKVLVCLNRPSPIKSPSKSPLRWKPITSTPVSSKRILDATPSTSKIKDVNDNNTTTDSATKVRVLQDVVIPSPKKCPKVAQSPKKSLQVAESPKKAPQVAQSSKKSPQVAQSPMKSPQKETVKDETKKLNFEQLRVMREFFINIIKHNHLKKLFSENDLEMLYKFFGMEKDYQYVCVKLFLWKPIWYNIFKYTEKVGMTMDDKTISEMYNFLKDNNFVDTDYMVEDVFTLLDLLTLKDVRDIGRTFKLSVSPSKEILIAKLLKLCKTQITLTSIMNTEEVLRKRIEERMGHCVKLSTPLQKYLYYVYLLNTFTNPSLHAPQDYFTNVSYFNVVFPTYNVENFNIFYTPLEFIRYADAVKLRTEMDQALEKKLITYVYEICKSAYNMLKQLNEEFGDSFDSSREPHLERYTPNAQYIYILSSAAKHITNAYHSDVKIWFEYLLSQGYCAHKRGQWYVHLSLIYTRYLKDYEKAARLLIRAFRDEKDNFSDIQLQELAYRGKMLNKKTYNLQALFHDEIANLSPPSCDREWPQDVIDCKSMKSEDPGRKRLYVHHGNDGDVTYLTVEQTALQYYRRTGFPHGVHCEGNLIIASFCLLFWDILYGTYVKGTFVSRVQNTPLDMYTKHFYTNREDLIKKRLNCISTTWSDETFQKRLMHSWEMHSHESSLCQVESAVDSPQQLLSALMCIGRPILAKIFERLVKNFNLYHSGFPDLVIWNLQEKRAKFVEVKSENDKLSIKQKLWLNYLIDIGASVAVCHVEPKASKKKIKSSKPVPEK